MPGTRPSGISAGKAAQWIGIALAIAVAGFNGIAWLIDAAIDWADMRARIQQLELKIERHEDAHERGNDAIE